MIIVENIVLVFQWLNFFKVCVFAHVCTCLFVYMCIHIYFKVLCVIRKIKENTIPLGFNKQLGCFLSLISFSPTVLNCIPPHMWLIVNTIQL